MSHRSLTRDLLEARMQYNPEKKAELLVHSRHLRHRKLAIQMTQRVAEAYARAKEEADLISATPVVED